MLALFQVMARDRSGYRPLPEPSLLTHIKVIRPRRVSHCHAGYTLGDDKIFICRYDDVTMSVVTSQITSLTIVYSTVNSDADQRKHQSSAYLVFVWGIRWWPLKGPVTRKMCPFYDVIMAFSIIPQHWRGKGMIGILPHGNQVPALPSIVNSIDADV